MKVFDVEVQIGEPQAFGGLSIFPLLGDDIATETVVSASRAIETGLAEVEELDSPSVPELKVKNHGEVPVLFVEGEILLGAAQDRTLNIDVLCAAGAEVVIPVSCVEAGRWGGRGRRVSSAKTMAGSSLRRQKISAMESDPATITRRWSDQSRVWHEVSLSADRHGVHSSTSALSAVNDAVAARVAPELAKLKVRPNQLGMVFASGSRVLGLELFGRSLLLEEQLPKIVRGYAVELGPDPDSEACSTSDVSAFLGALDAAHLHLQPGVSLGEELHLRSEGVVGVGLRYAGNLLHLAAFAEAPS